MRRFLIKLTFFSFPILIFVGYIAYDVLVLPVDYYTFRAWEALSVYEKTPILSGPFYPNMHLVKTELGDLSGLTKLPVPKEVEWFTDQYGYRKQRLTNRKFEIVVVGDSAIAGSSLTQEDMFSEVLEDSLGVNVYPHAPSDFIKFLEGNLYRQDPPDVVIFESAEKLILHIPEIDTERVDRNKSNFVWDIVRRLGFGDTIISNWAIISDRFKKQTFVNYLYAKLDKLPKMLKDLQTRRTGGKSVITGTVGTGAREEMTFYSEPEEYFKDWDERHIKRVIFTLKQYRDELNKTNTKLVFMPIPNKENIYWRQVNGGRSVANLKRLIDAAEAAGIPTIDLWTSYNYLYSQNIDKLLYHTDDTHWNAYGVKVAVEETAKKLDSILR